MPGYGAKLWDVIMLLPALGVAAGHLSAHEHHGPAQVPQCGTVPLATWGSVLTDQPGFAISEPLRYPSLLLSCHRLRWPEGNVGKDSSCPHQLGPGSTLCPGTFRHCLGAQGYRHPHARGTRSRTKGTFGTALLLAPECRLSYRNQRLFLKKNSSFALAILFFPFNF